MNSLQSSAFNLAPPPTLQWQPVQIANFTAVAGRAYPCNTTSSAFTVTLPASPAAGDVIVLTDYAGTWGSNSLTIARNGSNIEGVAANTALTVNRGSIQFTYIDSTQGWVASLAYKITNLFQPIEYLLVAGGGGGGSTTGTVWGSAGGGGGGGFRTGTASVVSGVTYTITVGNAGARVANSTGDKGGDSSISGASITENPSGAGANTIKSYGGGGGGGSGVSGTSGGSGGGSSAGNTGAPGNTPSTTPSQGNNGGNGNGSTSPFGSGGGGGAGAVGGSASPGAGNGGNGSSSSISGSSVTYSGGGGGGSTSAPGGTGGTGGGANGGANNGSANTGGGGGGAIGNSALGGSGGSGTVIIRYVDTFPAAASTTGSPTITVSGGYRVYAWTGNGSITF